MLNQTNCCQQSCKSLPLGFLVFVLGLTSIISHLACLGSLFFLIDGVAYQANFVLLVGSLQTAICVAEVNIMSRCKWFFREYKKNLQRLIKKYEDCKEGDSSRASAKKDVWPTIIALKKMSIQLSLQSQCYYLRSMIHPTSTSSVQAYISRTTFILPDQQQ